MKHRNISWNPATQEWFCTKCGRTSDRLAEQDARAELELYECAVPSVENPRLTPNECTVPWVENPRLTPNAQQVAVEESGSCRIVAIRLTSMLLLGSIPFAVLLFISDNNVKHYVSEDASSVFGGLWAILSIWIILDKGMDSILTKDVIDIAWSLIVLSNLIGVVLFFSLVK